MKHKTIFVQKKNLSKCFVSGIKKYFRTLFWSPFALMVVFCLLFLYALSYFMTSSILVETKEDAFWRMEVGSPKPETSDTRGLLGSLFSETLAHEQKIVVAVLDSGVDTSHPDLSGGLWRNDAEFYGNVGKDDDGNGFVDDIFGWDFVNEDPDVADTQGHGTHLSGIILQKPSLKDNVETPVEIMALKISEDYKKVRLSHVLSALEYARDNGADIINMSFGFAESSPELHLLIQQMQEEGVLFLAAAGNHSGAKPYYPAAYDEVFSVGSSDITGTPKDRSNFGDWVDAFFPGDYLSTVPGGRYGILSGTSQASAFATSLAVEYLLEHAASCSVDDLQEYLRFVSHEYADRFEEYFTNTSRFGWLTYSQAGALLLQEYGNTPIVTDALQEMYLSLYPLRMTSLQTKTMLTSTAPERFLPFEKAESILSRFDRTSVLDEQFHASAPEEKGFITREEFLRLLQK